MSRHRSRIGRRITVAAVNLFDEKGTVSFPADVIVFTEAILATLQLAAREAGFTIYRDQNRTVIIAVRNKLGFVAEKVEWHRAHDGDSTIPTPARGDLAVDGTLDGEPCSIIGGHSINGSWKKGTPHRLRRRVLWLLHRRMSRRLVRRRVRRGVLVLGAGDRNVKPFDSSERWYTSRYGVEGGTRLDRTYASNPATLVDVDYRGGLGSDHPRLVATYDV